MFAFGERMIIVAKRHLNDSRFTILYSLIKMSMVNSIVQYAIPMAAALLIMAFYLGLPALKSCPLPAPGMKKDNWRLDALLMALITGIYALTAFHDLGDTTAPQSFVPMAGREAVFTLSEHPAELMLYTGVGMGGYRFEISEDGENYAPLTEDFTQDHVAVLKWHSIPLASEGEGACSVKIACTNGEPWLGEVVFRDSAGRVIPAESADAVLCDEQALCPAAYSIDNSTYFDEIYHARTAWEHLHGVWPYEISHPPLGKLILSLGIQLFGMTPFGWRFSGTLFGVLMLPVMYLFLKKLFGGSAVPALGTLVFAADFMHFVQTRIATIDTYGVFFILLMYYFMYIWLSEDRLWALALAGIAFGLGAASKWICIYAGAGLGVLWLVHWGMQFAREGKAAFSRFAKNAVFCMLFFVAIPGLIYYLSYLPYGEARGAAVFTRAYWDIVWDNQSYMFSYHSQLVATHPYASKWYQWLLDIRPILYYMESGAGGERIRISAFVNPLLCWGGLLALFVLLYMALFRRDRRAGFLLIGFLAQLLPWVFIDRLTFAYHYFPSAAFLVLALGYVFALMREGRRNWLLYATGFTLACMLTFVLFYPELSAHPIEPGFADRMLRWLPTWPLVRLLL